MSFEQSPFGDGSASGSGNVTTAVNTHFGVRDSEQAQGVIKTEGAGNELRIEILGGDVSDAAFPLLAPTLPAGATVEQVYWKVTEAFVLGGTTPTIEIGTEGSESTNGIPITESQAETVATVDLTAAVQGTWANPLAADTTVGLAMTGTSPTSTSAGKAEVVIRYTVV